MCIAAAASTACCCLSSLCGGSCCGNSKMSARASRIVFAGFYFVAGVLALLLKYFGSKLFVDFIIQVGCVDPDNPPAPSPTSDLEVLAETVLESSSSTTGISGNYTLPCAGSQAVYRISFGVLSFFVVCGVISAAIRQFQHGWWSIKILLFVAAMVYPFFLPASAMDGYQQAARWFAGVFLIFQMLTYIAVA
jgi:hypothetical protein